MKSIKRLLDKLNDKLVWRIMKWIMVILSPFLALFILRNILNITEDTFLALLVMLILNIIGYFLLKFLSHCIVKESILVTRKHPRLKLVLGIILLFIAWLGMGLNLDKISVNDTVQVITLLVSLSYGFILLILNYEESKID